jgi:hypothetical protein
MSTGCTPEFNERTRQLQDELDKLKAAHAELAKNERRLAQVTAQSAAIREGLKEGKFPEKQPRSKPAYNEEVHQALLDLNNLRARRDAFLAKGDRFKRTAVQKVLGIGVDTLRASILASVKVFGHLAYAVAGGHVESLLADLARSGARVVPGLRRIADRAERYRYGLDAGALAQRARGLKEAPGTALSQLTQGAAPREAISVGRSDEFLTHAGAIADVIKDVTTAPTVLDKVAEGAHAASGAVGRSHAMVKEFLTQPEYRESLYRITQAKMEDLKAQGMSAEQAMAEMNKPTTMAEVQERAVQEAYDAKMQGKNVLNATVDNALATLDRSKSTGAHVLAGLTRLYLPIRKIGVNIADRTLSLAAGSARARLAYSKWTSDVKAGKATGPIPRETADYIMQQIGRNGAGAMLAGLGILYYDKIGSVPGVFKKKDEPKITDADGNPIEPHASAWTGSDVFHGSAFGLVRIGATMAQVYAKELGKEGGVKAALDAVAKPAYSYTVDTVPYLNTPHRDYQTVEYGRDKNERGPEAFGQVLGNHLGGFIPGPIRDWARSGDPYQGQRYARNIGEDFKLGLPGYREEVPVRRQPNQR